MHKRYSETLLEAHWAVQIPAAASRLIEPKPDSSHTNLLVEGDVLRGRPLLDGRRAEIDLTSLVLRIGEAEYPLAGRTLEEGINWLSGALGVRVAPLKLALPARPRARTFTLHGAEAQLQSWFNVAHELLSPVAASADASEVRVWPHHFDIATLIEIDEGGDEDARSINVGLSPGDGFYSMPYWYVTPWPRPTGKRPSLTIGSWHTEGFTAAVLPASEHDPEAVVAEATRFLQDAIAVCRRMLRARGP